MSGILEIARKYLRLPASLGLPYGLISATDKINDPSFATVIGLVKWGADFIVEQEHQNYKSVVEKVKGFFNKFHI